MIGLVSTGRPASIANAASVVIALPDVATTARLGRALAAVLRVGDMILLSGDLGVGKSELARAIVRAVLAVPDADVPSPTFTLVQHYAPTDPARPDLWHCDLYRLGDPKDVDALGLGEGLSEAAILVEWPDRFDQRLTDARLDVALTVDPDEPERARRATLAAHGSWRDRLPAVLNIAAAGR